MIHPYLEFRMEINALVNQDIMIMDLHFVNRVTNNAQLAKIYQVSAPHAISVILLGLIKA